MRIAILILAAMITGQIAAPVVAQQVLAPDSLRPLASYGVDIGPGWGVSADLGITYSGFVPPHSPATTQYLYESPLEDGPLFEQSNRLGFDLNLTFSFSF